MGPRGRRRAGARHGRARHGAVVPGRGTDHPRCRNGRRRRRRRAARGHHPGLPGGLGWDGLAAAAPVGRGRGLACPAAPRTARGDRRAGWPGRRLRGPVLPAPAVAGGRPAARAAHPPRHRPIRRRDRRGRRAHHVPRGRAARDLRAAPHPRLPALAPDRRRRLPGAGGTPRRRGRPGGPARARGARPARGRASRAAGLPGPAAGVRGGRRGTSGPGSRGAAGPILPSAGRPVRAHRVPHRGARAAAHRHGQHRAQQSPG